MFRRAIVATILLSLVWAVAPRAARAAASLDDATAAADAWLKLLDDQNYSECWESLSPSVQGKTAKKTFELEYNYIMKPLGPAVSREYSGAKLKGPGTAAIHYHTSWNKRKKAKEVVFVTMGNDGLWRVSGYNIMGPHKRAQGRMGVPGQPQTGASDQSQTGPDQSQTDAPDQSQSGAPDQPQP